MTFFQTYKNYIISLIIDLFLAIILVSIFRSSYSQDSFISDVVLYFIVIAVITIILGIKNVKTVYKITIKARAIKKTPTPNLSLFVGFSME